MRDHHALRLRGRAARVVESKQVALLDFNPLVYRLRARGLGVVLAPSAAAAGAAQRDEMLDPGELGADSIH